MHAPGAVVRGVAWTMDGAEWADPSWACLLVMVSCHAVETCKGVVSWPVGWCKGDTINKWYTLWGWRR